VVVAAASSAVLQHCNGKETNCPILHVEYDLRSLFGSHTQDAYTSDARHGLLADFAVPGDAPAQTHARGGRPFMSKMMILLLAAGSGLNVLSGMPIRTTSVSYWCQLWLGMWPWHDDLQRLHVAGDQTACSACQI
jgi:hypothetical protein